MPDHHEVTDSSDWLPTPLAPLAQLESSLRCQVCKDFFTTPMITSCSHTFCSLCIRRHLSQEGKCPACRELDQEIKLRRNWVVEELVTNFAKERSGLLQLAHQVGQARQEAANVVDSERPSKRRRIADTKMVVNGNGNGVERRSTRSQSKAAISASQQSARSTDEVMDSEDEGSLYEEPQTQNLRSTMPSTSSSLPSSRQPNDGKVACPCCGRRMKETQINSHLDKCIAGESHSPIDETTSPPPPPTSANHPITKPAASTAFSSSKPVIHQARLPFINYTLLTDNALRKKLKDLGIPAHGSKDLMRRRHTEWVNLWNANCDSSNPLSKRQLLQDLRVWEDTLGRQIERAPPSGFMSKDFDRDRHVKTQKDNFDELIRQARAKMTKSAQTTTTAAASNSAGDGDDDDVGDEKRDMNDQDQDQEKLQTAQVQNNAEFEDSRPSKPAPESSDPLQSSSAFHAEPTQLPPSNPATLPQSSHISIPPHQPHQPHQPLPTHQSIDLTTSPSKPTVSNQVPPSSSSSTFPPQPPTHNNYTHQHDLT
ncbi:DNA repair protein rad18 [Exophiala mesophila]|uniref:Postreplication repair E3 ubiquitin-protein ligase RAD18 n=1 Tax=Exophiala mesophila TaxID=212818 RepID=A0A0D1WVA1_EXOME|nr:DNA repair protein rad18 [Exophiala mesophila]KIV93270.1 DNA repair protein rad18 [Exophiala mesophila]